MSLHCIKFGANNERYVCTYSVREEAPGLSYGNYKEIDFSALSSALNDDSGFLSYKGLTFEEHVSSYYLTGNELLYYPKLTKQLRKLEYPLIKRSYEIDKKIKGLPFIEYFCQHIQKSFTAFEAELNAQNKAVERLISQHGANRQRPIINAINKEKGSSYHNYVEINGVPWFLRKREQREERKITEALDFHQLFHVPYEFMIHKIEDAQVGSTLIALRLAKDWQHKGRVQWYDLDSCQEVSSAQKRIRNGYCCCMGLVHAA